MHSHQSLEFITTRFTLKGFYTPDKLVRKRVLKVPRKPALIYFADSLSESVLKSIERMMLQDILVVLVTLDSSKSFTHPNLIHLQVIKKWYIHTLFFDPFVFKMVCFSGPEGSKRATAFSQFTKFHIPIIHSAKEAILLKSRIGKRILIKTYDGIGDLLMSLPTAKTYANQGYDVDYLVWPGRETALSNLDYIRKIYNSESDVRLSDYECFYDISFRLSRYSQAYCKQHRVKATAHLCGLNPTELVNAIPEIRLTKKEKDRALSFLQYKSSKPLLVVAFDSYDNRRKYPEDLRQSLVDLLSKHFYIVVVGFYRTRIRNVLNLTGFTTLREMFGLVSLSDRVLTVDTSVLHVAAAFNIPTVFLPSTVFHQWREYPNVQSVVPLVPCYPCNEGTGTPSAMCGYKKEGFCFRTINFNEILARLQGFQYQRSEE